MTNAPEPFDLAQELADTATWDEEPTEPRLPEVDTAPAPTTSETSWPDEREQTTGEQDLAARHQLRRVAGLSTELEDISEVEYRQLRLERVVLVGVWTEGSVADAENSMAELALLAETEPNRHWELDLGGQGFDVAQLRATPIGRTTDSVIYGPSLRLLRLISGRPGAVCL